MPHSVEIPAPVNGAITRASSTSSCRRSIAVSMSGAIMYDLPSVHFSAKRCKEVTPMRYLHTMLRVRNLDQALDFYCNKLGLKEKRRRVDDKNRYTLVFLAAREDYGEARYFGHLAYEVDDVYALCEKLIKAGVTINRPPRDGVMAFVRSPDKHSIELLQKGSPLPPKEPWVSMPNTGKW